MEVNNMGAHKEFIVTTGANPYPQSGSGKITEIWGGQEIYAFMRYGAYGDGRADVFFVTKNPSRDINHVSARLRLTNI